MTIFANPGGSTTVSMASGGKTYAYNNISEAGAITVAPANSARQRIRFHNPGSSDIFIAPAFVQNTGSNVALTPTNAALGGCTRVYGNGGTLEITGECQGAWQALAISGAGGSNPLTVLDSNT